jgi:predicted glycoside hydrolase/deacetylase ChbG (UPF0249 family)
MTEKLAIFAVDDVGSTRSANLAMVEAFTEGIATSCGVMVPCPWFRDAIALIREHRIPFGVHMVISCEYECYDFGPLTREPRLSRDGKGHVFGKSGYDYPANYADEVYAEIAAQVERVLDTGLTPTHLESHMANIPRWDGAFDDVCDQLWQRFGLPLLRTRGEKSPRPPGAEAMQIPWVTKGGLGGTTLAETKRQLRALLEACKPGLNWIGCHAAKMSPELLATGLGLEPDFAAIRDNDLRAVTDPEVRGWLDELGIRRVGVAEALAPAPAGHG